MDGNFKHVFEGLLCTDGPVAINIVQNRDPIPITHIIKHVLTDGTGVTRKKRTDGYSRSKNAVRMREKRKDPEYRKRENERENDSDERSAHARRRTAYYAFQTDRCSLRRLLKRLIGLGLHYRTTR